MRPVAFGFRFDGEDAIGWIEGALRQIESASNEDAMLVADSYTLGTFTPTRTLPNTGTATVADVANVLATFIDDLQKRSVNRVE